MDVVDIGGAAANGRPKIPPIQTVAFTDDGSGVVALNSKGIIVDRDAPDAKVISRGEVSAKAARAAKGSLVAYPEDHPANRDDLEQDADGALVINKGQKVSVGPAVLGDVRKGYKTGGVDGTVGNESSGEKLQEVDQLLNELAAEEELIPLAKQQTAVDNIGEPVIEVVFQTPFGAMASYYHKVVEAGKWLILIVDNRGAAKQRFIPKLVEDGAGGYQAIDIIVTGSDSKENPMRVLPLDMFFTVDNYDFMVMSIEEDEVE